MNISLNGKVAIVTGSIQGIGKEIAKTLSENGASVVINNHQNENELKKVAEELSQSGSKVIPVIADVSNKESAKKLIDAALELGGVDLLVNNAGGLVKRVPVTEFEDDQYNMVMNINLKTVFLMSHLAIPH